MHKICIEDINGKLIKWRGINEMFMNNKAQNIKDATAVQLFLIKCNVN